MKKLNFENYIYFPDKAIKFAELSDDEKSEFRKQMIKILQGETNLEYIEKEV